MYDEPPVSALEQQHIDDAPAIELYFYHMKRMNMAPKGWDFLSADDQNMYRKCAKILDDFFANFDNINHDRR
jgi:hypothetical protein